MKKILIKLLFLTTMLINTSMSLYSAHEIPIHIKITETTDGDTTTKEKDVYHVSIKPYEKKVITHNPKIVCTLIDKTKTMTTACKEEFDNVGIIPIDICIKNNSAENDVLILPDSCFENNICLSRNQALTILENTLLRKKRITVASAILFLAMITTPAGMLGYSLTPFASEISNMIFEGIKKTPSIFSTIFSLPFSLHTGCIATLFLTLNYLTPKKLIEYYENIFSKNYLENHPAINYFWPIKTLKTIQQTLNIVEKIKQETENQDQITIEPGTKLKTTIFAKSSERDGIYHNIIIPELCYTAAV